MLLHAHTQMRSFTLKVLSSSSVCLREEMFQTIRIITMLDSPLTFELFKEQFKKLY